MKFEIVTRRTKLIAKALNKMQEKLTPYNNKGVGSTWELKDKKILLEIVYYYENRLTNMLLERELKRTLRKLDPKIKVNKVR